MTDGKKQTPPSDISQKRGAEWLVSLPTLAWLTLFVVVPTLLVFVIAFRPANPYGGIGAGWTLENVRALWTPATLAIAWRTLWISLLTTAISLVLAIPAGYTIARASARWRNRLLMLVIVPSGRASSSASLPGNRSSTPKG